MFSNKGLKTLTTAIVCICGVNSAYAYDLIKSDKNNLSLNGLIIGRDVISKDDSADGDKSRLRLTINGDKTVNESVRAYGVFQYEFWAGKNEAQTQKSSFSRLAYAGFDIKGIGSIDYGRNWGIMNDVGNFTNTLPMWGGDSYAAPDVFMTRRSNGLLTFRRDILPNLKFGLQYQSSNTDDDRSVKYENGDGIGSSVIYSVPDTGLTLGAAYSNSSLSDNQKSLSTTDNDRASMWTAGAKYKLDELIFAGTVSQTDTMEYISSLNQLANSTTDFELQTSYSFGSGFKTTVTYIQSKASDMPDSSNDYLRKYTDFLLAYSFDNGIGVSFEYKWNLIDDDNAYGLSSDDAIALSATYQF